MRWLLDREPFLLNPASISFVENPIASMPFPPRFLPSIKVWGYYLALLAWPLRLSVDYSYHQIPLASSIMEAGVLVVLGLIVAAIAFAFFSFSRKGQVWFYVLFFFLMLVPASNIPAPIGTIMAERLLYLPCAGVYLLVGILWQLFLI